jgi:hypothetical protein
MGWGHLVAAALALLVLFVATLLVSLTTRQRYRDALSRLLTSETLFPKFWYATLGLLLLAYIALAVFNNR